jgi:ubiquinone/menaquinone biosynthesis C-methylase UbiE
MPIASNLIVETYSRLADLYDDELNARSCWGRAADQALSSITLRDHYHLVLDVGCGTGRALVELASRGPREVRFVGLDPAPNMRARAVARSRDYPNLEIRDGSFEKIPLADASVDYLFSIFAFHWTTHLTASVQEIARVLKPGAEMYIFFMGGDNGREFIQKTTPIFLKYMGPQLLLDSARMRKQITRDAALQLFSSQFDSRRLSVEESFQTYYDTLEGHWGWWIRIEGHFVKIPSEKKQDCDREVQQALKSLEEERGIPYTIHQLHVRVRQETNLPLS